MPSEERHSFWQTVPGILTALATLVTAVGGAIAVMKHNGPTPNGGESNKPVKAAFMGALEPGVNLDGGDLSPNGIPVSGAGECSELCQRDLDCKAMTFVKHATANGGVCWLKRSVPERRSNPDMVSAVKRLPSD